MGTRKDNLNIMELTLDSIEEFDNYYREVSGHERGIESSPEYFITTHTIQYLHSKLDFQCDIISEPTVSYIIELSNDTGKSRSQLPLGRRYDFALVDRHQDCIDLFEVKHRINGPQDLFDDFGKIYSILRRDNDIQSGFIVYTLFGSETRYHDSLHETVEYLEFAFNASAKQKRSKLDLAFDSRKLQFDLGENWISGIVSFCISHS